MANHDDFFGGSITPNAGPTPVPGGGITSHVVTTKGYGRVEGVAPRTARSSAPVLPIVVGMVVIALAAVAGFYGYRMYFAPKIVMPENLFGYLDRANLQTDVNEGLDEIAKDSPLAGPDVDVQQGIYGSADSLIYVIAGDAGTTDQSEVDAYFDGLAESMRVQLPGVKLTDEPAGPVGGSMKCFKAFNGASGCAWVSEDTFGLVVTGAGWKAVDQTPRVREEIER